MMRTGLRGLAALCLFVVTAILLAYVPTVYYDAHYLGALFIFASIAMLGCAVILLGGNASSSIEKFGWTLGAVILTIVFGGFVASRTVGLVAYHDASWIWPGIVNMVAAVVFDLCFLTSMLLRNRPAPYPTEAKSFGARRRAARQRAGLS